MITAQQFNLFVRWHKVKYFKTVERFKIWKFINKLKTLASLTESSLSLHNQFSKKMVFACVDYKTACAIVVVQLFIKVEIFECKVDGTLLILSLRSVIFFLRQN